jgi:hypothetical protein
MSLDRRRLGDASPTANFKLNDKLVVRDEKGVSIAKVKITGRIRDHSIAVTDAVEGKAKITFVGREIRYTEIHSDRTKVWRNVRIEKEAE